MARALGSRSVGRDRLLASLLAAVTLVLLVVCTQSTYWSDGRFLLDQVERGQWQSHHLLYLPTAHLSRLLLEPFGVGTEASLRALSAAAVAAGIALAFLAARALGCGRTPALVSAALLLTAPAVWFYGTCIEVHALQVPAAAATCLWCARRPAPGARWPATGAALLWILLTGTHMTGALWGIPLLVWLVLRRRESAPSRLDPWAAVALVGTFAVAWVLANPSRYPGAAHVHVAALRLLNEWRPALVWNELLRPGGFLHFLALAFGAWTLLRPPGPDGRRRRLLVALLYACYVPFAFTLKIHERGGYYVSLLPVAALATAGLLDRLPRWTAPVAFGLVVLQARTSLADVRAWEEFPESEWIAPLIEECGGEGLFFSVDPHVAWAVFHRSRMTAIAAEDPLLNLDLSVPAMRRVVRSAIQRTRAAGHPVVASAGLYGSRDESAVLLRELLESTLGAPRERAGGAYWMFAPAKEAAKESERLVPDSDVRHLLDEEPDVRVGSVRRARAELQVGADRLQAHLELAEHPLASRHAPGFVLLDHRDAWASTPDARFEVDLPRRFEGVLLVDLAVGRPASGSEPDGLPADAGATPPLEFVVGLTGAGREEPRTLDRCRVAGGDETLWEPRRVDVSTAGLEAPRLVLESRRIDETSAAAGVRAWWAAPALVADPAADDGAQGAPDVLLISVDTLRADHLGAFGYERDTSPNLDDLIARGVLFERAISAAPWTLPSYASLFTGRYPSSHGGGLDPAALALFGTPACGGPLSDDRASGLGDIRPLPSEARTAAELLRSAGYRTAAFVNNPFLHPERGVDQGFELYAWYQYTAAAGVDRALGWIDRQEGAPFFAFLHLLDPHFPYAAPDPFRDRFRDSGPAGSRVHRPPVLDDAQQRVLDRYDGEIAYTDAQVGRLIEELERRGQLEGTVVILHSDHGEELWDHGGFEHGHTLHRELVHVPLAIVHAGRIPAGTRVSARVRTIDVLPTLLELLGARPGLLDEAGGGGSGDSRGTSLVPWIDGERSDDLAAVAEAVLYGPPEADWWEQKTLYDGDLKLIVGGSPASDELYDLSDDPAETTNVAARHPEAARALRERLLEHAAAAPAQWQTGEPADLSPETRQALERLGYTD